MVSVALPAANLPFSPTTTADQGDWGAVQLTPMLKFPEIVTRSANNCRRLPPTLAATSRERDHLAAAREVDSDDLARRPVREVQPVTTPARRLDQTPTSQQRPHLAHSPDYPSPSAQPASHHLRPATGPVDRREETAAHDPDYLLPNAM